MVSVKDGVVFIGVAEVVGEGIKVAVGVIGSGDKVAIVVGVIEAED